MRTKKFRVGRTLGAAGLATIAVLVLASCAPPGAADGGGDASSAPTDTFTVGLVGSSTGFAAATGINLEQGWDLYWKQHDNKSGNFEIKTVFEDDASDAEVALTKATRLISEEKVDVLVGPTISNSAIAIADYAAQQGVANLTQASPDNLTQDDFSPLVLRTGAFTGSQYTYAGGQWAYEQGYRTLATVCVDYAYGWDNCGGFVTGFVDAGGKVVQQLWYPANATDLSSYVAQLVSTKADVVFAGTTAGSDASNFIRTASDFGLFDASVVVGAASTTGAGILADVGDVTLGMKTVSYYAEASEVNADFLKAFEAEYGVAPTNSAVGGYATAQMLDAALSGASEKLTGEDLINAIKGADISGTPWGDISFDDYNNIVGPVYIREVEKRKGTDTLWNVPIETYEHVSQFGDSDPEEVIARPPFSQTVTGQ